MRKFLYAYGPGLLLFIVAFIVGLATNTDHGLGWDEVVQKRIGETSYNYIVHNDPALKTDIDKDYGVAFELVLTCIQKGLDIDESRDYFLARHIIVHTFFLLSILVAYVLFYKLFRSNVIACVGFLLLLLQPRLYGHSFINSKDIPFLSMFLISMTLMYAAFRKDKPSWYLLLGLAIGYTTGIRIMGVMLFVFVLASMLIDLVTAVIRKENARRSVVNICVFVVSAGLMLYVSWPNLWEAPVKNFIAAFNGFAHYIWNGEVLFNGVVYTASTLPATYAPLWFVISTPLVYLLLGAAGALMLLWNFSRSPMQHITNTTERLFMLFLFCFVAPFAAVIILRSTLYDDWRHLYFAYAGFVVLILYCISRAGQKLKWVLIGLCGIQFAFALHFMVKYHPMQQAYFNELVTSSEHNGLVKRFEVEYWGAGTYHALNFLAETDKSDTIRVLKTMEPVPNNLLLLNPEVRARFKVVDWGEKPYYLITNYRVGGFLEMNGQYPLLYKIDVLNNTVTGLYWVEK